MMFRELLPLNEERTAALLPNYHNGHLLGVFIDVE
jgi:hypothetical protein